METEKNTVLIVDDEKVNIYTLTDILSPDYTIFTAKTGQDAIEIANNYLPDIILLDIIMPEMDGYEVIKHLKKSEKTKQIPIIIISGLSNAKSEEKGLSLGASDYIAKPFSSAIIKLRVQNQIQISNYFKMKNDFSMTDTLTGLPNKYCFDERMHLEWEHSRRNKTPLGILIINIDKFRIYNEKYGHSQGDAVIKSIADCIKESLNRAIDFIARWKGGEFAVLLPFTDLSGAVKIAEKILKSAEKNPIAHTDGKATHITVSIGVNSIIPVHGCTINEFLENAAFALSEAKNSGKNKVCKYDTLELTSKIK